MHVTLQYNLLINLRVTWVQDKNEQTALYNWSTAQHLLLNKTTPLAPNHKTYSKRGKYSPLNEEKAETYLQFGS